MIEAKTAGAPVGGLKPLKLEAGPPPQALLDRLGFNSEQYKTAQAKVAAYIAEHGSSAPMPPELRNEITLAAAGMEYKTIAQQEQEQAAQIAAQRASKVDVAFRLNGEIVGLRSGIGLLSYAPGAIGQPGDVELSIDELIAAVKKRNPSIEAIKFEPGNAPSSGQFTDYFWMKNEGRTHHGGPPEPLYDANGDFIPASGLSAPQGGRNHSLISAQAAQFLMNAR